MSSFSYIQVVFLSFFLGHFEDNACSSPHTKPVEDNYSGNSSQVVLWDFLHNSYTVNQDVWWRQFLGKEAAKTPAGIKLLYIAHVDLYVVHRPFSRMRVFFSFCEITYMNKRLNTKAYEEYAPIIQGRLAQSVCPSARRALLHVVYMTMPEIWS